MSMARAWMLDADGFHDELATTFDAPLTDAEVELRERATLVWRDGAPAVQAYVEVLTTETPDEWQACLDERHLVDWYRVTMAPYLLPVQAFACPDVLKCRLPELGWSPSESRRLAFGREINQLAAERAPSALAERIALHAAIGAKGWLCHDDVCAALDRFRGLERSCFRGRTDLVGPVEDAYRVLEAAANKPDHVLILAAI